MVDVADKARFPLKVAFISPFNLFDAGSGAAQSVRTMLEQLAARGASCHALTACCFDAQPGEMLSQLLHAQGLQPSGQIAAFKLPVWQGSRQGVSYNVIQLPAQVREQLTAIEELAFRDAMRVWLAETRPDVVITFGGMLLDIEIQRCIRAAGVIVAFYLPNPNYGRPETFANVNLILTNSSATAEHYAKTMNLQCHNVGLFVDTQGFVAAQRTPQFVSFINPLPEKGVTLFVKLVQRAAQERPDIRFLVVESRGLLKTVMQKLNLPVTLLEHTMVLPKQERMAAIYANTRILLMPSYWFESAGRILIEANANGIPVLASNRGGIAETLGDAGCLLPIPDRCNADYWAFPSDDEVEPWWVAMCQLWDEPAHYEHLARKAIAAAQDQSLARKAEYLELLLQTALGQTASTSI